MGKTMFDKIWEQHTIKTLHNGEDILFIDRHLLHEVSSPQAFEGLRQQQRSVRFPSLAVGTEDHIVSTMPNRVGGTFTEAEQMISVMRKNTEEFGISHHRIGSEHQGIVHIIAPEQGIIMPGMTVVCGDSHTCTLGALGTIAFGIGTSEVEHVLATQTIVQRRPSVLRLNIDGNSDKEQYILPKDYILHICRSLGSAGAKGSVIEFAGTAISNMSMEGRLTICNMAIEIGARSGFISPDKTTIDYIWATELGKNINEKNKLEQLWLALASDPDAEVKQELMIDISNIEPQITWGTLPSQSIPVSGTIPIPKNNIDERAIAYMGLTPGQPIRGTKIDTVFIGSCTNSRISDLRIAASVCRGKKVAPHVVAYVIPGSERVKRQAEKEGLLNVFTEAGFQVREPGCSMCVSVNREFVEPYKRCVSTSNRNFEHRQGPNARTHLGSPALAAASAIVGKIEDPRSVTI
ncbi:3-isopropylmalate dehydratase large subunit [Xenorhabdus thailandensis]|uniref:3-isopropylmalate dehydratase large subunit n=1 Tax=Xenorhabdus thailandensis TaxID=3136255 RepID=UPI0030F416E7